MSQYLSHCFLLFASVLLFFFFICLVDDLLVFVLQIFSSLSCSSTLSVILFWVLYILSLVGLFIALFSGSFVCFYSTLLFSSKAFTNILSALHLQNVNQIQVFFSPIFIGRHSSYASVTHKLLHLLIFLCFLSSCNLLYSGHSCFIAFSSSLCSVFFLIQSCCYLFLRVPPFRSQLF